MGTGGWGLGTGDWGVGNREPLADSRCRNQLSAYRLPLSEFAYYFFSNDLNNQLANRESGIGKLTADSW